MRQVPLEFCVVSFLFLNFFSSAADFGIAKVMHGKFAQTIVGKLAVLVQ